MAPSPKETSPVLVRLWPQKLHWTKLLTNESALPVPVRLWIETFHCNARVMLMNSTPPLKGIRKEKSPPSNPSELCTTERHTEKRENSVIHVNHMNHVMHVIQEKGHPLTRTKCSDHPERLIAHIVLVGPGRRCTSTFRPRFFFTLDTESRSPGVSRNAPKQVHLRQLQALLTPLPRSRLPSLGLRPLLPD